MGKKKNTNIANDNERVHDKDYLKAETKAFVRDIVSALEGEMDICAEKSDGIRWNIYIDKGTDEELKMQIGLNEQYKSENREFLLNKRIGSLRNIKLRLNQSKEIVSAYKNKEKILENMYVSLVYDDDNGYCVYPGFGTGIEYLTGMFFVKLNGEMIYLSPNLTIALERRGIKFDADDLKNVMVHTLTDDEYYFEDKGTGAVFVRDKLGVTSSLLLRAFTGIEDHFEQFGEDLYITVYGENSLVIIKKSFYKKIGVPEGSRVGMLTDGGLILYYDSTEKDIRKRIRPYELQ